MGSQVTTKNKTSENVAVSGADVVAYYSLGEDEDAVLGDAEYSYEWNDVEWRFSSAENLAAFSDNPSKYAPQYGGYCAWAASQGYKAPTIPDAWSVIDGKLYLNASKGVRAGWLERVDELIVDGNQNWPGIVESQ